MVRTVRTFRWLLDRARFRDLPPDSRPRTVATIAAAAGVHRSYLYQLADGTAKGTQEASMGRIATALGCTPEELQRALERTAALHKNPQTAHKPSEG